MKHILIIGLAAIGILLGWSFLLLPFEIYDEQSHYASVNYLSQEGYMPNEKIQDLSLEEERAERYLGVMTDGTNQYMYAPKYHPAWTDSLEGKYEYEIHNLNTLENRSTYTIHQAAIYPPLYYRIVSLAYHLTRESDIIGRIYATRLISLFFTVGFIVISYYIGLEIFRSRSLATTLAVMTLFYPMSTFIGAGINSDNLHNLLFSASLLIALRMIISGFTTKSASILGVLIGLDLLTKPQGYILFPVIFLVILLSGIRRNWKILGRALFFGLLPLIIIAGYQEIPKLLYSNPYVTTEKILITSTLTPLSFVSDFVHTAISQLAVWYWGVFKWNTILMPKIWWWCANHLIVLAFVGCLIIVLRDLRAKRFSHRSKMIIFAICANLLYLSALVFYDWQYIHLKGHSLGFQARYFMPLLPLQLSLILMGVIELGWTARVREYLRRAMALFFIGLQLTAIYTVASSYYDLSSLKTFIIQASQYKPIYAKGSWWYLWLSCYIIAIGILVVKVLFKSLVQNDPLPTVSDLYSQKPQKYVQKKSRGNT